MIRIHVIYIFATTGAAWLAGWDEIPMLREPHLKINHLKISECSLQLDVLTVVLKLVSVATLP